MLALTTFMVFCLAEFSITVRSAFANDEHQHSVYSIPDGNTNRLRHFYLSVAKTVQTEGAKLSDQLESFHDKQKKQNLVSHIKTLANMNIADYESTCSLFNAFKLARRVLDYHQELKSASVEEASKENLDALYRRVSVQCPKIEVAGGKSSELSLLLTDDSGWGQFMGRKDENRAQCCLFDDKVKGEEPFQLTFHYQHEKGNRPARYNDHIFFRTLQTHVLNFGGRLHWNNADSNSDKRGEWTVEPYCQGPYEETFQCDLVSFSIQTQRGFYLAKSTTSQARRLWAFAILHPSGRIPH